MKKLKLIAGAALIGALSTASLLAQNTAWRIVSGPGFGNLLYGNGSTISSNLNPQTRAAGFIAAPHAPFCDCPHYHGSILGKEDNDEGCGWGCVVQVPVNITQARNLLTNAIANSTGTNSELRAKLTSLVMKGDDAIASDCNSLFRGILGAMGEELFGAILNGLLTDPQIDTLVNAIAEYAALGFDEMDLPFPPMPPPQPCKVQLLLRRGSTGQMKLFDAKRKVNADVGEVVVLDAQGCPDGGSYEWEYKFKGGKAGDVPSRTGISFTPQRVCVLSEKATTVTVTVIYHCPDGRTVKDTATVTYQ